MVFILGRKHTYEPTRPVTRLVLLSSVHQLPRGFLRFSIGPEHRSTSVTWPPCLFLLRQRIYLQLFIGAKLVDCLFSDQHKPITRWSPNVGLHPRLLAAVRSTGMGTGRPDSGQMWRHLMKVTAPKVPFFQ
jgi:hypothetical protein